MLLEQNSFICRGLTVFGQPTHCLPGFSVHGISQAGILEWVEIPSLGIFPTQDQTTSPALAGGFFTTEPPGKPNKCENDYM